MSSWSDIAWNITQILNLRLVSELQHHPSAEGYSIAKAQGNRRALSFCPCRFIIFYCIGKREMLFIKIYHILLMLQAMTGEFNGNFVAAYHLQLLLHLIHLFVLMFVCGRRINWLYTSGLAKWHTGHEETLLLWSPTQDYCSVMSLQNGIKNYFSHSIWRSENQEVVQYSHYSPEIVTAFHSSSASGC